MTFEKNSKKQNSFLSQILIFLSVFLILFLIAFHKELNAWIASVYSIFRPVIFGLILAYLTNPVFRFFEGRVLFRLHPSALRRALSLLFAYLFGLIACALLFWLILPQLISTVVTFVSEYQMHVDNLVVSTNGTIDYINHTINLFFNVGNILEHIDGTKFFAALGKFLNDAIVLIDISNITATASSLFSIIADLIFALFISIYLLSSKEKRYAQVMKLRHAIFNDVINQRITKICTSVNKLFSRFVEGRLLDALFVGVLTYAATMIFGIPYALLIATFIAVLNIIPIIGFLIGVIPSALIVVLTDSDKLLPFLLIVFIIYQIDINIISPRILGYNTGVSALCVIIAISTMGAVFGIVGMIIAVPLFATVIDLLDAFLHQRLQHKRLPDDVENYYAPDPILDPLHSMKSGTGRLIMMLEKRVLYINSQINRGHADELSKRDHFILAFYRFARRLRLLPNMPTDVLVQFSAEHAEKDIATLSRSMLKQKRAALEAAHAATETEGGAEE
ncbi:MAG: AI-2E family transporter [Clostridia bacterium]|nr:AI-2E family transporter [Clostridia bacterium]